MFNPSHCAWVFLLQILAEKTERNWSKKTWKEKKGSGWASGMATKGKKSHTENPSWSSPPPSNCTSTPYDTTSYLSHCISRKYCHNWVVNQRLLVFILRPVDFTFSTNTGFWLSFGNQPSITTTYQLQWRRPDIHYITWCIGADKFPQPPVGGSISYEPHPLIRREPQPEIWPIVWNGIRSTTNPSSETDLEHWTSISGKSWENWGHRGMIPTYVGQYLYPLVDGMRSSGRLIVQRVREGTNSEQGLRDQQL